ncbi:EAL domain-containing protein [Geminicoccaceae bacterium 1502E]|nr:EAL domain-containing protein [Geminicoccaceae bacterium 1502E]
MAGRLDFLISALRRHFRALADAKSAERAAAVGGSAERPPPAVVLPAPLQEAYSELESLVSARTEELRHAKSALEASRRRLSFALESAGESLWEWDVDSDAIVLGQAAPALLGISARMLSSGEFLALMDRADRGELQADLGRLARGEQDRLAREFRIRANSGRVRWISCRAGLVEHAGSASGRRVVGMLGDITERKTIELRLAASEERLSLALDAVSAGIIELDLAGDVVELSPRAAAMLGCEADRLPGDLEALAALVHPDDRQEFDDALARLGGGLEETSLLSFRAPTPSGSVWISLALKAVDADAAGRPGRLVGITLDVSAQKQAENELAHMALHDPLTGLANRARFASVLGAAVRQVEGHGGRLFALMIDLDRLKLVNDTHGHAIGDRLIAEAARRLSASVRNADLVARLSGDEFAILVRDDESRLDPAELAARILERFETPYAIDGHQIRGGASVGIALFPEHAATADSLLACADKALYAAKGAGRQTWRIFQRPGERGVLAHEGPMDARLEKALENGELELHYQPIVAIEGGRAVGVEALLRWRHPTRGLLAAGTFMPQVEHRPFMLPLTRWTIEAGLADVARWRAQGRDDLPVWINIAPRCLGWKGLVPIVSEELVRHDVPPGRLVLEITEGAFADFGKAAAVTRELRDLGVDVALDDFGAGFSSLARLKTLPLGVLKIDRGFVENLTEDRRDGAIIGTVVALARSLGAVVLAEGVESRGQLRELAGLGCNLAQGYLFARPMPAAQMLEWLDEAAPAGFARSP